MASLGGKRTVTLAVTEEARFAEPGAGRDHRRIAPVAGNPGLEDGEVLWFQYGDAIAVGFEVIDKSTGGAEAERDFGGVERPREVCGMGFAVDDGAGYSETAGIDFFAVVGEEIESNFDNTGMGIAAVIGLADRAERRIVGVKERDASIGTADVAGKNHVVVLHDGYITCRWVRVRRFLAG